MDRADARREDYMEPRRCPRCEGTNLVLDEDEQGWWIICMDCDKISGPVFKKPDMMIKI